MKYRNLGKSGLRVSVLSFGSWVTFGNSVDKNLSKDMIKFCYDNGVNFFDNAEGYEHGNSERVMGQAIKELGLSRDTFTVSSKVFFGSLNDNEIENSENIVKGFQHWTSNTPTRVGLNRKHIKEACNQALTRLQVNHLDLYFCHRPDIYTPVEEIVRAMTELIYAGKIMYWGTSEWPAQRIMEAHMCARQYNLIPPTMEQPQYNMFTREKVEKEYARIYSHVGLGTTVWSPLASGILTGKYNEGIPSGSRLDDPKFKPIKDRMIADPDYNNKIEKVKKLTEIANELGCSMSQLAIAWSIKNPNVSTTILGASKLTQLQETLKAIDFVSKIDQEIDSKIEEILNNKPLISDFD